jgi:hypothetical protein
MNANSRMFKELRRGETWVVSDNNNRRRRRRRRRRREGIIRQRLHVCELSGGSVF